MMLLIRINKYWRNLVPEEAKGHGAVCTRKGVGLRAKRGTPPSTGGSQALWMQTHVISVTGEIKVEGLYLIVFIFFEMSGGVSRRECGGGGWIFEKSSRETISSEGGKVNLHGKYRVV